MIQRTNPRVSSHKKQFDAASSAAHCSTLLHLATAISQQWKLQQHESFSFLPRMEKRFSVRIPWHPAAKSNQCSAAHCSDDIHLATANSQQHADTLIRVNKLPDIRDNIRTIENNQDQFNTTCKIRDQIKPYIAPGRSIKIKARRDMTCLAVRKIH